VHKTINNLISIENILNNDLGHLKKPKIIAISKTFTSDSILPLINHGHEHFGENKVQEAVEKWMNIKKDFKFIKLHMVGKLQTNKVKYVIPLFDYIHSLDNIKLAEKISKEQIKANKKLRIFIQINIGNELQKSGIELIQLKDFYEKCVNDFNLNIVGLMCLPPKNKIASNYFSKMKKLSEELKLKELSMGMSEDFFEASKNGSTFLRIGTKIFGNRS